MAVWLHETKKRTTLVLFPDSSFLLFREGQKGSGNILTASAAVFNMSALVQYHQIIFCGVKSKMVSYYT